MFLALEERGFFLSPSFGSSRMWIGLLVRLVLGRWEWEGRTNGVQTGHECFWRVTFRRVFLFGNEKA